MAVVLEMPRYGATMEEGLIAKWLVGEGDAVLEGDVVCSIEIEKAVNDLTAPITGVLRRILLAAGETAPCGTPIGIIAAGDEDISTVIPEGASPMTLEPGERKGVVRAPAATTPPAGARAAQSASVARGPRAISPKAAQLARELQIDWQGVAGTGRLGMITRADLRSA